MLTQVFKAVILRQKIHTYLAKILSNVKSVTAAFTVQKKLLIFNERTHCQTHGFSFLHTSLILLHMDQGSLNCYYLCEFV